MEAFGGGTITPAGLAKLYTDTRQSYHNSSPAAHKDDSTELTSLQQRFHFQKDRLVAWGFEWSDANRMLASIDAYEEHGSSTEIASSVLENIRDTLDSVEKIDPGPGALSSPTGYPVEKNSLGSPIRRRCTESELVRYAALVDDLTSAIDLLCDLSKERKTSEAPRKGPPSANRASFDEFRNLEVSNFNFQEHAPDKTLQSQRQELPGPLKINISSLILPNEDPPPNDNFRNPSPVRTLGYLRNYDSSSDSKTDLLSPAPILPVLIEYATFDSILKGVGQTQPMSRLEHFSRMLHSPAARSKSVLPKLAGYFEDPHQPRIGLVYDISTFTQNNIRQLSKECSPTRSTNLFNLLQSASRSHLNPGDSAASTIPTLEERFRLADELISAFTILHEHSFTHREVNSNCVVFFSKAHLTPSMKASDEVQYDLRKPLICAFDLLSEHNVETSPEFLHQNMYRHPNHPRVKVPDQLHTTEPKSYSNYFPEFDLYSLGLILLEIGLWVPLADIFKEKYTLKAFQTRVEKIWTKRLAAKCGSTYMRAVQDCLSIGNQIPISGNMIRQTFYRVKARLQRCCYLDDDGDIDAHLDEVQIPNPAEARPSEVVAHHGTNKESYAPIHGSDVGKKPQRLRFPSKRLPAHLDSQSCDLSDHLMRIVCKALRHNLKESVEVGVEYTGVNRDTAKPTFIVACTSTKLVRAQVRRYFKYSSDWDVVVVQGRITQSHAVRSAKCSNRKSAAHRLQEKTAMNPFHHQRPLCGASIGAWRGAEHLLPVTFGGVIMIDDKPYGLSVHHLMESPAEESNSYLPSYDSIAEPRNGEVDTWHRSIAPPSLPANGDSDIGGKVALQSSDVFAEVEYRLISKNIPSSAERIFPEVDNLNGRSAPRTEEQIVAVVGSRTSSPAPPLLENEDDYGDDLSDYDSIFMYDEDEFIESAADELDNVPIGDVPGILPGQSTGDVLVTQPALDDVDADFFPVEEDRDEDHLSSHTFARVHASSGIRRRQRNGITHEVDWALLKIKEERLQPHNIMAGGKRFCSKKNSTPKLLDPICRPDGYQPQEDLYVQRVADSDEELGGLKVHCFGRTSGLAAGQICEKMRNVKLPGRATPAKCWFVTGGLGVGGDSGAWVVDNEGGRLCGHVIAWSYAFGGAYISPMDMMFEDIKATLGASKVCLPGAGDEVAVHPKPCYEPADVELPDIARLSVASASPSLLAHHMLMSGAPGHLEREWAARRTALGQTA